MLNLFIFLFCQKGKVIDENYDSKHDSYDDVILSDDEDDRYGGQLDKMDTEMHFGGAAFDRERARDTNPYGPSDGTGAQSMSIGDAYRSRKNDLDEMIRRRKIEKAEKAKTKEEQGMYTVIAKKIPMSLH